MKPEVGQRWRLECGCAVELGGEESTRAGFSGLLLAREVACSRAMTHFGWLDSPAWFVGAEYLGPTPAAPLPSSTVGAPEGYVPCPKDCGRWTSSGSGPCFSCHGVANGGYGMTHPDWTPPTAAPPTREQILAEERAKPAAIYPHMQPVLKTPEEKASELATVARVRAHQLAEGGDSAVAKAPGRTRDTFSDLADEWDLLPEAGR